MSNPPECHSNLTDPALRRMKIAVAMACLRSKPPGMSGREFAQQLCDRFRVRQLQWKDQLKEAQTQILGLKQQLTLQTAHDQSPPLTQPTSQQAGSGEPLATDSQPWFPTPPSSGSEACVTTDDDASSLPRSTAFLHHSLALQSAAGLVDPLIKESVLNSLDLLHGHLGRPDCSWRLQMQCVGSIGTLVEKADAGVRTEIVEKVVRICGRIIHEVADPNSNSTHDLQERRIQLVCQLSAKCSVILPVLDILCCTLHTFSDHLRVVTKQEQILNPYYFTNMYYIVTALDNCVTAGALKVMEDHFRESLNRRLEDCLLHVSRTFPLFAHAIWKVCSKLSSKTYVL